uniref:Zinc finger, CCHC-type n=1 Tax=Tanacetum cinerariifolium TaxID=118510 RepID=A0A6L2NVG1_TANCI|nr:zinc finger, CCHC-type [Tanacetum cinerariifolium]
METILKAYGIWETIVAKEGVTTIEKKENTSKAIIFQTLPQDVLMQVAQYSTAKKVWDSIKVKHLGADLVQKARLQTLRNEMSFEEAVGRLTPYKERIKSQDTLEANDQDKLLMASSNNKSYGKWRGLSNITRRDGVVPVAWVVCAALIEERFNARSLPGDVNKAEKKPLMDRVDSVLKEITAAMKQLDRSAEAIKAINSFCHLRLHEPQESLTNIMLQFYKCGRIENQI